jgi:hypothetical protein
MNASYCLKDDDYELYSPLWLDIIVSTEKEL